MIINGSDMDIHIRVLFLNGLDAFGGSDQKKAHFDSLHVSSPIVSVTEFA